MAACRNHPPQKGCCKRVCAGRCAPIFFGVLDSPPNGQGKPEAPNWLKIVCAGYAPGCALTNLHFVYPGPGDIHLIFWYVSEGVRRGLRRIYIYIYIAFRIHFVFGVRRGLRRIYI